MSSKTRVVDLVLAEASKRTQNAAKDLESAVRHVDDIGSARRESSRQTTDAGKRILAANHVVGSSDFGPAHQKAMEDGEKAFAKASFDAAKARNSQLHDPGLFIHADRAVAEARKKLAASQARDAKNKKLAIGAAAVGGAALTGAGVVAAKKLSNARKAKQAEAEKKED